MYPIKQSTALAVTFFVHDENGDPVTGLTNGSFTKRIKKAGGSWAAMTVTITEGENGWYSIPLSTSHSNTLELLSVTFTNAGAKQVNLQWRVEAKLIDDLNDAITAPTAVQNRTEMDSNSTQLTAIVADTNELQGDDVPGLIAALNNVSTADVNAQCDISLTDYDGPTNAEMIARTILAASYFDPANDDVAVVTAVTNQVSANMTAISGDTGAADNLEASMETLVLGTATGTPTTTTMADSTLTEATNDHYNGRVILWRTGALTGQASAITAYNGTTKTFTFTEVTNAASASDAYVVV